MKLLAQTKHTARTNAIQTTHATHTISDVKAAPPAALPIPKGTAAKPMSEQAKQASTRELAAHAKEFGIETAGLSLDDIEKRIQSAELALAQKHDPRITKSDMDRAVALSQQAALLVPARQSDLFGFTRVVDSKLALTPATLELLAAACVQSGASKQDLLIAVKHGPGVDNAPGGIAWPTPKTPVELVASLVRQVAIAGGASRQLTLSPELLQWLDTALVNGGVDVKKAMGGAGAFAANLAAAVGVESSFYSAEPLPTAIAERFAGGVSCVDKHAKRASTSEHQDATLAARTNTACEYGKGEAFTLFGASVVDINGKSSAIVPEGTGRVILGTQAKDVKPGFHGVDDKALQKIAKGTDVFFFVGVHYLTQGPIDDANALAQSLDTMKKANPKLLRHVQYVTAKVNENEAAVWGALKGRVDSLALNAVEVAPFVDSLFDGNLAKVDIDPHLPREAAEDPLHMLEGALAIVDALDLSRIQLHGLEGDLVVTKVDLGIDPERQKLALLKARQLASNKAANESGEIKTADDVWPVVNSVRGTGLSAVQRFADACQQRFGLTDKERDDVASKWFVHKDGVVVHFAPSRGIHDRAGGTVSLGDTIDSSSIFFALDDKRPPKLKHGSSFT